MKRCVSENFYVKYRQWESGHKNLEMESMIPQVAKRGRVSLGRIQGVEPEILERIFVDPFDPVKLDGSNTRHLGGFSIPRSVRTDLRSRVKDQKTFSSVFRVY